ncbi:MAG: hypothetical protein ACSLEM_04080 [Candidatus Malihini olakiniferum]
MLIKQCFICFIDPVSPDKLASPGIENEVISHSLFNSYNHLGEHSWFLLVKQALIIGVTP